MVPRKEIDARSLDDDVNQYGQILYQNSENFNQIKKRESLFGLVMLLLLLIILIFATFIVYLESPTQAIVLILFGIALIFIMILIYIEESGEFRIHKKGIRFSNPRTPFLHFTNIDHIERWKGEKYKTPMISIITKSNNFYWISGGPTRHVHETPEDYFVVYQLLVSKLKETFPKKCEDLLIRDINAIEWDKDARNELDRILFTKHKVMLQVVNKVIEDGRTRVTLEDFQRYS